MKILLAIVLLFLNIWLITQPKAQVIFPFIPPLTHTPGMGLSLLGQPSMPPFLFLPMLQDVGGKRCSSCPTLEMEMQQQLEQGKKMRLQMQTQTIELLSLLPKGTVENALRNRDDNEQRIGEVLVWKQLQ